MENFKEIHIGKLIKQKVKENGIDHQRICNFFKYNLLKIQQMYSAESIEVMDLLKWSKLLEYDFFRLYSHHLILYSPPKRDKISDKKLESTLPSFRKSLYTKEIIDFILELFNTGQKTKRDIMEQYNIPKTTLYKWIEKYNEAEKKT